MNLPKKSSAFLLALAIGLASGCASTARQETAGQYIDDATVTARVKTAIYKEPTLKVSQINVETMQGTVQLSGFVDSSDEKSRAAEVARDVNGVKSVRNDIRVR